MSEIQDSVRKLRTEFRTVGSQTSFFNGSYWELIPDDRLKSLLASATQSFGFNSSKFVHHSFQKDLFTQFVTTTNSNKSNPKKGLTCVNFVNGTLTVTKNDRCFVDHNLQDYLTYQLPFAYVMEGNGFPFKKSGIGQVTYATIVSSSDENDEMTI